MASPNTSPRNIPAPDPKGHFAMRQLIIVLLGAGLLCGCSDLNSTQQRALTGTVGGAGVGAVLGAIGGNAGLGAIAGAGAGLIGGLVYDNVKKNEQSAYQQGYQNGKASH
jgi:hypothetical protein